MLGKLHHPLENEQIITLHQYLIQSIVLSYLFDIDDNRGKKSKRMNYD